MNKTQERVITVLQRMIKMSKEDEDNAEAFANELEEVLENLYGQDFFGTEGQCDPRGNKRESEWSMDCVEGVD